MLNLVELVSDVAYWYQIKFAYSRSEALFLDYGQDMHCHASPFLSPHFRTKLTRYQDVTPLSSKLPIDLIVDSSKKMRPNLNPGSVALCAWLLVILAEVSTSSVSTKKDCPKGQVRVAYHKID